MKKARIIGIVLAILFIITIAVLDVVFTKIFLEEMQTDVSTLSQTINETNFYSEEVKNLTVKLNNSWTNKEKLLCLIVNHKDIEEIGECLEKMQTAQKTKDWKAYEENIDLIAFYLTSYQHLFSISIQNVF